MKKNINNRKYKNNNKQSSIRELINNWTKITINCREGKENKEKI